VSVWARRVSRAAILLTSHISPLTSFASWSRKIRVQSSAIRAETEITAIQAKSHHCSNPWRTNTNGRFPNPQWTLAVSHGHGHRKQNDSVAVWRLAFGVWRLASGAHVGANVTSSQFSRHISSAVSPHRRLILQSTFCLRLRRTLPDTNCAS
jgi:hypothetical protein